MPPGARCSPARATTWRPWQVLRSSSAWHGGGHVSSSHGRLSEPLARWVVQKSTAPASVATRTHSAVRSGPASRKRCSAEHRVRGEDDLPVGARIVVPHDLVGAVADVADVAPELVDDALVASWMPTTSGHDVGELLGEEARPGPAGRTCRCRRGRPRRAGCSGSPRARSPRRRGAVRSGRIVVVVAAAGREQPRHEQHRGHPHRCRHAGS